MSAEQNDCKGATLRAAPPDDPQYKLERGLTYWYRKALEDFRTEAECIMGEVVKPAEDAVERALERVVGEAIKRNLEDFRRQARWIMGEEARAAEDAAKPALERVVREEIERNLEDFRRQARRIMGEGVGAAEPEVKKMVRDVGREIDCKLNGVRQTAKHIMDEMVEKAELARSAPDDDEYLRKVVRAEIAKMESVPGNAEGVGQFGVPDEAGSNTTWWREWWTKLTNRNADS